MIHIADCPRAPSPTHPPSAFFCVQVDLTYLISSDNDEDDDETAAALGGLAGGAGALGASPLGAPGAWGPVPPPGFRDAGWGQRPGPEDDVPGVLDLLTRALRRGGGGTVAMVGPQVGAGQASGLYRWEEREGRASRGG